MSKVLLIDADSSIPNIPLMKISTYHKNIGDSVSIVRLNLPHYPKFRKRKFYAPRDFDKTYCSVVFEGNKEFVCGDDIVFGGTGYSLHINLPYIIEHSECDYSLYPGNDTSYGFITRGCIKRCSFCKVPEKEGKIRKVFEVDEIVRHKRVKFLDNNILAYDKHKDVLLELVNKNLRCQFNQGIDICLVDRENADLLLRLNYDGEYSFAFDDWKIKEIIEERLPLLKFKAPFAAKFFVYVNPSGSLQDVINRVVWLKDRNLLAYIMRDISCYGSKYVNFYTDIAAYCNQYGVFKSMGFCEFLVRRHTNQYRISESRRLWLENGGKE